MNSPKVSVIIPAYNQGYYIDEAIQSVLAQTYADWELLIIDDGSTDSTKEVISKYDDSRIRYIYQENTGLPGARNTGISNATGEYLVFLDADDKYHKDKLSLQSSYLDTNKHIGVCYSSRIEIDQNGNPIWLIRSPQEVSMKELVLGFPFTINDIIVQRQWLEKSGAFDETYRLHGEDRVFYLHLALNGCKFGQVDRCLAYRRIHFGRVFTKIQQRLDIMLQALDEAYNDSRCPIEVVALKPLSQARIYLNWALQEFIQGESLQANIHIKNAVKLDPEIYGKNGFNMLNAIAWFCLRQGPSYEKLFRNILDQLGPDLSVPINLYEPIIANGYIKRGVNEVLWNRTKSARDIFTRAYQLNPSMDENTVNTIIADLMTFQGEFGEETVAIVMQTISQLWEEISKQKLNRLRALYQINQAYQKYKSGEFTEVLPRVIQALMYDPFCLLKRGNMSMALHSMRHSLFRSRFVL